MLQHKTKRKWECMEMFKASINTKCVVVDNELQIVWAVNKTQDGKLVL